MYWPIGAPRIYAPTKGKAADAESGQDSDEDAESRATTEENESSSGAPSLEATTNGHTAKDEVDGASSRSRSRTPSTTATAPDQGSRHGPSTSASPVPGLDKAVHSETAILGVKSSRTGHLFAVITATTLAIWQTKPTAILATVTRSAKSLAAYDRNVAVLMRPDSAILVVQTAASYMITYTIATDDDARVYKPQFDGYTPGHARRNSNFNGARTQGGNRILWGPGEGGGAREVSIKFRMVIKVDAGISKALALDDELVVTTKKPAAVQCIRWRPDNTGSQTSTELFSRMDWMQKKVNVTDMIFDRPMSLLAWVSSDGRAYAVQRTSRKDVDDQPRLFRGYCFHTPATTEQSATKVAINARFSLIAVACIDGSIRIYMARDYVGNIPLSHVQSAVSSPSATGEVTCISYSPDGYCLFVGFEKGWAMWSVFGKAGASSFSTDRVTNTDHEETWLNNIIEALWIGGGSEILLASSADDRLWTMDLARSALAGCYSSANISRTLLQTSTSVMLYRGHDLPDLTRITGETSLWHTAPIPSSYLVDQWPIRSSAISPDGRYVAVAGRRGLAHYSFSSSRWKTFVNESMENEFQVRGGICWHQHILVAAVEAGEQFELRLYSRELALDSSLVLCSQTLPAPIVLITLSGQDSLLVYTYENLLYHYIFITSGKDINLVQVGQIAFHGIVRSPARVRALSWVLPDEQLVDGDPSQDVALATVLFLVDGKLVLLQPSVNDEGNLKYDMKVIAQNVEYYVLMRDQPGSIEAAPSADDAQDTNGSLHGTQYHSLQDSLWVFNGNEMRVWANVRDILRSTSSETGHEISPTAAIPVDFYPSSVVLEQGLLLGLESDTVQRRAMSFTYSRVSIRTQIFLPRLLRFHLSQSATAAALQLARHYQHLQYFAHALEILLHDVLDDEVEDVPSSEEALLPRVLEFLSSFPQYLDIVVRCTRKTEVRSWRTLFAHLPPPQQLFEESLERNSLKTAGGYLLVLHTFEEMSTCSEQLIRLLTKAKEAQDWELCKELARFLMALDESGNTLVEALDKVGMRSAAMQQTLRKYSSSTLHAPSAMRGGGSGQSSADPSPGERVATDYFSS